MPTIERLQTKEQILSAFESVPLGDQSPTALKAAVMELIGVSLVTTPHFTEWTQRDDITKEGLFENHIQQIEGISPTFWEETKIVMDQFNLPKRTRKAFLLSLSFYEWSHREDSLYQGTLSIEMFDSINNVLTFSDFVGKLPENTPEIRDRFLFLLTDSLIQYLPSGYGDPSDWSESRKYRQELIEYERRSGVRLLTVFMETAGKAV